MVVRTDGGDRLSASDASNVLMDARDQVNVFLMAGLLGPGGFVSQDGAADISRLRMGIAERLGEGAGVGLSRLAERVRADRRGLVWEHCELDLTRHVRVVDAVGGEAGLARLCASLMTTPLPDDRPLWEVLIVPGASAKGPGVVVRFHHAVADGVGAVALIERLFGQGRVIQPVPDPPRMKAVPRHRGAHPGHGHVQGGGRVQDGRPADRAARPDQRAPRGRVRGCGTGPDLPWGPGRRGHGQRCSSSGGRHGCREVPSGRRSSCTGGDSGQCPRGTPGPRSVRERGWCHARRVPQR